MDYIDREEEEFNKRNEVDALSHHKEIVKNCI